MEQYLVAVIGAPESGKTVYLATLSHLLGEARLAPGLAAVVRPAMVAARLESTYQRIADPAADFPPPTPLKDITQWDVECGVFARGRTFPLMTISYFDAAGEWVRKPLLDSAESELFHGLIDRIDAVLAFVDGDQLVRHLDGEVVEATFVKENVKPILQVINRCSGPVHIVITKWDLLQGRYSLEDVRASLLGGGHNGMSTMVAGRRSDSGRWLHSLGRVRLIPVTSLGSFAFIDAQGYVQKRHGMEPAPMNVLVPFAAVLPDLCTRAAEAEAAERVAAAVRRRESRQDSQNSGWELSAVGFRIPLNGIAMALTSGLAATSSGMVRLVLKGRVPIGVALAMLVEPKLKRVKSRDAAFRYMMKCLIRYLRDFERDFPPSRLA